MNHPPSLPLLGLDVQEVCRKLFFRGEVVRPQKITDSAYQQILKLRLVATGQGIVDLGEVGFITTLLKDPT